MLRNTTFVGGSGILKPILSNIKNSLFNKLLEIRLILVNFDTKNQFSNIRNSFFLLKNTFLWGERGI